MRFALTLSALAAALWAGAADIEVSGFFDPKGSHVQGLCFDGEHYYLTQMTGIYKVDKAGTCVKKIAAPRHTGDICCHGDRLYTADCNYDGPRKGQGAIRVYDKDLNLVRERFCAHGLDGIAWLGGALFVGGGSNLATVPHKPGEAPKSKTPHRENVLLKVDPETLETISRHVIDFGHETSYGIQNIATDGRELYCCFYSVAGAPGTAVYDGDAKLVRTLPLRAGNGFAFLDERDGVKRFLLARTFNYKGRTDGPISCRISTVEAK